MNNFNLHPLSRHSPPRSSSSEDQYTHHHRKADSAYSSFSGGSTAPDYPSSFLADDFQHQNLHYTDLKYVKAMYSPSILNSNSHLYQSMEATVHQHIHNGSYGRDPSVPFTHSPPAPPPLTLPPASPPPPTPPPPDYLDSFISPGNLEPSGMSRTPDDSTFQPQLLNLSKSKSNLVYDLWVPKKYERKQALAEKTLESRSESVFTRQSWEPEHLEQKMMEKQLNHRRSRSACGVLEQQPTKTCWHMEKNTLTGSIQHKGQFYFITGVYKSQDSSIPPLLPCSTDCIDLHTTDEAQRSHNTVKNKNLPLKKQSGSEIFLQEATLTTEETLSSHHFAKPPDFADLEVKNVEMGRCQPKNHQIFFVGPENSPLTSFQHNSVTSAFTESEQNIQDPGNKNTRRPTAYVPTEKINKETTPLLYHLTGASRARVTKSGKYNRNSAVECKEADWSNSSQEGSYRRPSGNNREAAEEEKSNEFYYLCNTMDDSFKKYYKEKLKDAQSKVLRETSYEIKRETVKQQNVAQPQVPRIGCRKRLTLEQKKLSNSEPEKLHHLEEGPRHMTCRSLGSEREGLLSEEHAQHSLVAVRRKIFEVRGRAMSACSFSKNSLKNFQQKALAAFMERKSGCKVAEPQQASPQIHAAGRQSDWGPQPHSEFREKPRRPQSASHIYDSGFRHSQFTITLDGQTQQSSWKEQHSAQSKKFTSVEDLLEEQQIPRSHRSFSTSSPYSFYQNQKNFDSSKDSSTPHTHPCRAGFRVEVGSPACKEHVKSVPDQKQVRRVASRGKSMEELGTSAVFSPKVLSKSSDQLNQIKTSDRKKKSTKFGSEHIRIRPDFWNFQESGSLATAGTSWDRTSPVPVTESKVTATSSSSRGTSEKHQIIGKMQAVPQETFLIKDERSHGDVGEVREISLGYGITTDRSLWLSSTETNEEKTHSVSGGEQKTAPDPSSSLGPVPSPPAPSSCPLLAEGQKQKMKVWRKCPVDRSQWVMMVQEVVTADPSLAHFLYPGTNRKTAVMLIEQMLSKDNPMMENYYKKKQEQTFPSPELNVFGSSSAEEDDDEDDGRSGSSAPHDCMFAQRVDVTEKKRELMAGIQEQLESLEEVRSALRREEEEVNLLGRSLKVLVEERCSLAELERYTQFIEDLERVISLLFCLSARLARVQNALSTAHQNMDPEEKDSLLSRHQLLCKQREDAKDLKENLDRRERMVSTFLAKQLMEVQLQEYRRFIQNKASLLIHQKELEEKQRLGKEQLQALLNSIPP
ncbi:Protein Shroom1 [Bagarius yarrelli]|uniref:Protein Shroom1 n=1 Tax=Bagarius yarrelli TaxID=175774 RepID=A0A556VVH9_BAGYA|nr:Protein Shroom1 [Bagarius yarrelli]